MNKTKKIFSLIFILGLTLTSCNQNQNNTNIDNNNPVSQISKECSDNGGTWLENFQECEYVNKDWCEENNGKFFECESACRNNPEAEICTMQCIQVCKFLKETENNENNIEKLSLEKAKELIGSCEESECSNLEVKIIDGENGDILIESIYGLMDDSVKSKKIVNKVDFIDGEWKLGEEIKNEFKCHPGRGHEDFGTDLCN